MDQPLLIGKNVRIRSHKAYPHARNHVTVGRVLGETPAYLLVEGCSFHFGRLEQGLRSPVSRSPVTTRAIPWSAIEVVTQISSRANWGKSCGFDDCGNLILLDEPKTIVSMVQERSE